MDTVSKAPAMLRLSELPKGQQAFIERHDDSDFELTLLEMGFVPGEAVHIEMVAPLGDPIAIKIAGYYLSIRKQDAYHIRVVLQQEL